MRTICCLLAVLFHSFLFGQKTEAYFDYNWKPCLPENARFYTVIEKKNDVWQRSDYFVRERYLQMQGSYLDEKTNIGHGAFTYYHSNGRVEGKGIFEKGKRDGLWLWFYDDGMMSDSSNYKNGRLTGTALRWYSDGMIKDSIRVRDDGSSVKVSWFQNGYPSEAGILNQQDKPHGKWRFYHSNSTLSSEEIYDNGTLLDKKYFTEEGQPMTDTTSKDRAAKPQSVDKWKDYLHRTAYFPSQYKITGANEAVVLVRFAVNEAGDVVEPKVTYSLHPDFDKIVYEAIKRAPKWLPAIDHNRKVKTYHIQPITFAQTE